MTDATINVGELVAALVSYPDAIDDTLIRVLGSRNPKDRVPLRLVIRDDILNVYGRREAHGLLKGVIGGDVLVRRLERLPRCCHLAMAVVDLRGLGVVSVWVTADGTRCVAAIYVPRGKG